MITNKRKMLVHCTTLEPKRYVAGCPALPRGNGHEASGGQTKPKLSDKLSVLNVVSPYHSPTGVGGRKVRRWCAGKGLWRKRKPTCNKADRGLYPDTKVCRLPYGD